MVDHLESLPWKPRLTISSWYIPYAFIASSISSSRYDCSHNAVIGFGASEMGIGECWSISGIVRSSSDVGRYSAHDTTDVADMITGAEIGVNLSTSTELEPVTTPPETPLVPEIAE